MAGSSDVVKEPSSAAEEATSVSVGTNCLLELVVTSATVLLLMPSVKELEELAWKRFLAGGTSWSVRRSSSLFPGRGFCNIQPRFAEICFGCAPHPAHGGPCRHGRPRTLSCSGAGGCGRQRGSGSGCGPRAIGGSLVSVPLGSVGPVVRGGVEGGVGLPRALSDVREPVCLVVEIDLAFAVTVILGRIRPETVEGDASCGFRRLINRVRSALLGLLGIDRHYESSVVDGEVVCGHLGSESASVRDHPRRLLRGEAQVGLGGHAGDTPLQEV